ncbi:hypothetical protein I7I53_07471 [Histoplasma capsulatum var. duboisii H88]|uniref:Uncharacterized protein n=1 Tax=Ajellomyces capsulatus (strain H88) TaxID=544711 RepID=A0A8A1LGD0_AJEC8|nr:hypothetical protein I7I53_07471 [Histoplasma capsulatum var. duboisii H88]
MKCLRLLSAVDCEYATQYTEHVRVIFGPEVSVHLFSSGGMLVRGGISFGLPSTNKCVMPSNEFFSFLFFLFFLFSFSF